jgi:hypothetical protein
MRRGLVYIDENYAEFGPIQASHDNIRVLYEGQIVWGQSYEALKANLGFDYAKGYYVVGKDTNKYAFTFGREAFPYNLDKMVYNAKFEERLFEGKQKFENLLDFKYINEMPYTFGLEFETAGGYLPQHRLYELGLIPLRDGSITGIEYATVVLQGTLGLNLLKQQMEALDQTTIFDKDCSLHVHFGGFPLKEDLLLMVNNLFVNSDIRRFLPQYTFDTPYYKTNQDKNYCEFNGRYRSFNEMYSSLVKRNYFGDLHQPHPNDLNGTRKWNIKSRYKAVNFINALCYDGPKTIEFRMLRPTYNFNKVLGWLFIYAAFIKYAENCIGRGTTGFRGNISIETLIKTVYSSELAEILCNFLYMSEHVVYAQHAVKDFCGMRVDIDDKIINYQSFGHFFY